MTATLTIDPPQPTRDFETFYETWFDRVYNYARHRTGSPTRADEIVSDVFTRAYKGWNTFDPDKGEQRTWLFAIAYRCVMDHYRAEKRRKWLSLGLLGAKEPSERGPEAELGDAQKRLFEALAALDERSREIVTLKFFSGLTNRVIAAMLDLSESNVAVILYRSVRRMRTHFPEVQDHDQ